jgi:hypothetical protein
MGARAYIKTGCLAAQGLATSLSSREAVPLRRNVKRSERGAATKTSVRFKTDGESKRQASTVARELHVSAPIKKSIDARAGCEADGTDRKEGRARIALGADGGGRHAPKETTRLASDAPTFLFSVFYS